VVLYITAGEETGSEGAFVLARRGMQGEAGALVVAEPSDNRPFCGHKGALWLKATTRGVTAHGSMPDKGVNAVYAAARAVSKLEAFDFNVARHAVMGGPTLNVGNFHGGLNVNSVPDRAEIGIDLRTLPGMRHSQLVGQLGSYLGPDVELRSEVDVESVWTRPDDPWMKGVFAACQSVSGPSPVVEAAPYFTDASALTPALGGVPTVILGPGPTHMAHQTDEWCDVARIEEATRIYERLIRSWCGIKNIPRDETRHAHHCSVEQQCTVCVSTYIHVAPSS
jgi:succinyl-diaminopimelate desuccinylase